MPEMFDAQTAGTLCGHVRIPVFLILRLKSVGDPISMSREDFCTAPRPSPAPSPHVFGKSLSKHRGSADQTPGPPERAQLRVQQGHPGRAHCNVLTLSSSAGNSVSTVS